MHKLFKKYYLFLILFIIYILKEPFYRLLYIDDNIYNTTRCEFLKHDYNKLLEFLEIDLLYENDFINSYIIYKDIYNYMNEITIRGGLDKKLDKYPVIYDNTLLGVINKINNNTSIVKLITNPDSKISVKINEEIGLLSYSDGKLLVKNLSNYSNININDNVYTSGLGNIKENIYIGEVKDIIMDDKNIEKIAVIDYKLKIKDIDYVTIIKEKK